MWGKWEKLGFRLNQENEEFNSADNDKSLHQEL